MNNDTESIKTLITIANDLTYNMREICVSTGKMTESFLKFTIKLAIAFVICVAMLVACIMYALYQAYNYDGYSSNPTTIQNNNIAGKDNQIQRGDK